MKKILILCAFVLSLFANEEQVNSAENSAKFEFNPNVDCLILEDENSIICKFEIIQDLENEQKIVINWVNPDGEVSRTRDIVVPKGDSSAYDFRYIEGRELGKWDFSIIYRDKEYKTSFELKD